MCDRGANTKKQGKTSTIKVFGAKSTDFEHGKNIMQYPVTNHSHQNNSTDPQPI